MSFKDLKITAYQDSVSALPDYPSDAGITAAQLKAVFDGRTDKEIKSKFNALIDELITKFGLVDVDIADAVEQHQNREDAHEQLFSPINERIAEIIGDIISIYAAIDEKASSERMDVAETDINTIYGQMNDKVDKVAGKGLSTYDFNDEWKQSIQNSFHEAIYAQTSIDEHREERSNPHNVTAAQIGAMTSLQVEEKIVSQVGAMITPLENDIVALQGQVGDIETALDVILAIQNKLIGG